MAKQHFYSRVPARGSLYNRADGFDTFAHSEGLSREFVERELSAVYENKLGKQDAEAVRTGQMPVVYSQSCLRSGALVHSCVSYLAKDYTGERSAYLCHSLILSEEEKRSAFYGAGHALLNPEMLVSNADSFDLSTQIADDHYPEKVYVPGMAGDPKDLVKRYDTETVKSFLFAVLNVLCAKGKPVYFKLSCKDAEASSEALKFIDMIAAVIPYHLRGNISFVTYVTDPAQYAHVKIKCVSADCPENLLTKGIFVDLGTNHVSGMPASDVIAKAPVNFFYSLLEDATIRNEFLQFVDKAVASVPELEKLNMKTLSDLVFLFGGASGLYDQNKVLPTDEDVLTFLSSYEKYCTALGEESRRNAYKCLERYPQRHTAIPKNIFAKVVRMYGAEQPPVKHIFMNVVLELIHTDVMRDKLFVFLKNSYDGEEPEIQKVIAADLCRVYYGGFLQLQILDFFHQHFATEPEETQDMILDKLMLTIRTASVQGKIVAFIGEHYAVFTDKQKQKLYETIFEMLPECDRLTEALVDCLNAQMEVENGDYREQTAKVLAALLSADYKEKEHNLMPILAAKAGFCRDLVIGLAFGSWNTRKIHEEYMALLSEKKVMEKTQTLVHIFEIVPGEKTQELLLAAIPQLYANTSDNADIYHWMEVETFAETELARHSNAVAAQLCTEIFAPNVVRRIGDVYVVKQRQDGLQQLTQYAKDHPYVRDCETYKAAATLRQLMDALENGDVDSAFCRLVVLLRSEERSGGMSAYVRTVLLNWETQAPEQAVLCEMCCNALEGNGFFSDDTYMCCKNGYAQILSAEEEGLTGTKLNTAAACNAAERILRIMRVAGKVDADLMQVVCQDQEGIGSFLSAFSADYGRGADKWILATLEGAHESLIATCEQVMANNKPRKKSFLAMLFGKK